MNDSRDFDQWLSQELTRHQPHIDDAGFTDRVMTRLPQTPPKRQPLNGLALALLALTAGLLGLNLYSDGQWLNALIQTFANLSLLNLLQWGLGMTLVLSSLMIAVLWPNEV